jgi:hypothetical protein
MIIKDTNLFEYADIFHTFPLQTKISEKISSVISEIRT